MKLTFNLKNRQVILNIALIILPIVFLFLGCYSISKTDFESNLLENKQNHVSDLEQNHRKWNIKNINSYNFVARIVREGINSQAEEVLIEVRNGQAISIKPVSKSDQRDIKPYSRFETVEKMFDVIQVESEKGASVIVSYNKELGYPEKIGLNYAKSGSNAWFGFYLDKFEVINTN